MKGHDAGVVDQDIDCGDVVSLLEFLDGLLDDFLVGDVLDDEAGHTVWIAGDQSVEGRAWGGAGYGYNLGDFGGGLLEELGSELEADATGYTCDGVGRHDVVILLLFVGLGVKLG